jgi:hypothetical protein
VLSRPTLRVFIFYFNEFYSVGTACTKVHIMVAHTSKVTEIMSDRCAGAGFSSQI